MIAIFRIQNKSSQFAGGFLAHRYLNIAKGRLAPFGNSI